MEEDEEELNPFRLSSPLKPLLSYGAPIVGAAVWAFATFPDRLRWTNDVFAKVFGLAAPFYEDLTHVDGYGDPLDAAIDALERAPTRVLDLGTGTGYAARRIQEAFPDAEVIGIDLSPEMVLMARAETDKEGGDAEFEVGDAAELTFEDESFDLVVSMNAPPHPEEILRVLRPGGTALAVWSFGGPWVSLAWPTLAKRLRKAGAVFVEGHREGTGFYGMAEKTGIRRRRRRAPEAPKAPFRPPTPPKPAGKADEDLRRPTKPVKPVPRTPARRPSAPRSTGMEPGPRRTEPNPATPRSAESRPAGPRRIAVSAPPPAREEQPANGKGGSSPAPAPPAGASGTRRTSAASRSRAAKAAAARGERPQKTRGGAKAPKATERSPRSAERKAPQEPRRRPGGTPPA